MMKKVSILLGFCLVLISATCNRDAAPKEKFALAEPPKLVVVLVVDQMRQDYFDRFGEYFKGGLKKLWEEGAVFTNAHHYHGITHTAAGHATLSTGCYPSAHGIVANDFFNRQTGEYDYSVVDKEVKVLGVENNGSLPGRSPMNLRRTALGDWLKKSNSRSRVFSVSIKDRTAVLMGGKKPNRAFWMDPLTSRFVSVDYYGKQFPTWATQMNGKELMAEELANGWNKILPEEAYQASREDDFAKEQGTFIPAFPHTQARMRAGIPVSRKPMLMLQSSPFGDDYTIRFAKKLLQEEGLGKGENTDMLMLGLSNADVIGHHFGPISQEVQDYYAHLDNYLEDFFDYLDQEYGSENYMVAFSSDHGVLPMPEELKRQGVKSRRVLLGEFSSTMDRIQNKVKEELELEGPLFWTSGSGGVSLIYQETRLKGLKDAEVRKKVAEALLEAEFIADTYTPEELTGKTDKPYIDFYRNSNFPDRGQEIKIRFKENYLINYPSTGTGHFAPYSYDTHVPIIFMGPSFQPGKYNEKVYTVDFAPTVAFVLGLKPDRGVNGQVLEIGLKQTEEVPVSSD